ncbi:MAG: hypothetical protein U0871_16630 [Gemmataceae bacterium]
MSHFIRLRGFWTVTPADGGRVRHARRFGKPTNLGAGETVWLVGGAGTVLLNGEPVGGFPVEVTSRLLPRNDVAVELPADAPLSEVGLEVRPGPGER